MPGLDVSDRGSFVEFVLGRNRDSVSNGEMLKELNKTVSRYPRATLLLTSDNGEFCWNLEPGERSQRLESEVLKTVRTRRARTMVAVGGRACGFGLHLAFAADRLVASTSASFELGDSEPPPTREEMERMLALLGPIGTRELVLLNSVIRPQRMLELHAAAAVVPPARLLEVAETMADDADRTRWRLLGG